LKALVVILKFTTQIKFLKRIKLTGLITGEAVANINVVSRDAEHD
jgi:hypothetical protein